MAYNLMWMISDAASLLERFAADNATLIKAQSRIILRLLSGRKMEARILRGIEFSSALDQCRCVQEVPHVLLIDFELSQWKDVAEQAFTWRSELGERFGWHGRLRSPMIDFFDSRRGSECHDDDLSSVIGRTEEGHRFRTWEELQSPFELEALLKRSDTRRYRAIVDFVVGTSEAMASALYRLERFAPTDDPVLIAGETGTGKTPMAYAIHHLSKRAGGPFLQLDLSTIPEQFFESTLFGYARQAFTGATSDRGGVLQEAERGTLFLDELGNSPTPFQKKLLVLVETGEYRRLGETRARRCDVRIIVGMNVSLVKLVEMVEAGTFKRDLYHRLESLAIEVPPLRERKKDIYPLAKSILADLALEYGSVKKLDPTVMPVLLNHEWPGNVRQLRGILKRAFLLAGREQTIGMDHMDNLDGQSVSPSKREAGPGREDSKRDLEDLTSPIDSASEEALQLWLNREGAAQFSLRGNRLHCERFKQLLERVDGELERASVLLKKAGFRRDSSRTALKNALTELPQLGAWYRTSFPSKLLSKRLADTSRAD